MAKLKKETGMVKNFWGNSVYGNAFVPAMSA